MTKIVIIVDNGTIIRVLSNEDLEAVTVNYGEKTQNLAKPEEEDYTIEYIPTENDETQVGLFYNNIGE